MMKLLIPPFSLLSALIAIGLPAMSLQAQAGDDFGRLFTLPGERKTLDVLRQNQKLKVVIPQDLQQEASESAEPAELPDPVTMQGYVKRSDGATTLWINNKAVQENSTVDDVRIGRLHKQAGAVQTGADNLNVQIPANGKNIHLKAGQVYVPETNQIKELKLLEKEKKLRLEETGVIGNEAAP